MFLQKQNESAAFLSQLPKYLGGRPATLQNMWNVFDFMNVQSIHNATFYKDLPPTFLAQARDLANWHEYNVFSSPQPNGIGNIAGQTILPSILNGIASITNSSNPQKLLYQAISYKPFLSLFNMTSAVDANPQLASIVNYAAAVSYEIRRPASGGEPVIRFNFKNGTDDADFNTYNFLNGSGDIPVSTFVNSLSPYAINITSTWCSVCKNNQDRGCAALTAVQSPAVHQKISPVGAGFLGAGLTLVVVAAMIGVLLFLGVMTVGKKGKKSIIRGSDTDSEAKA